MITCGNCAYYDPWTTEDGQRKGDCRRHAPRPIVGTLIVEDSDLRTNWPITFPGESCGEGENA